MKNGFFIRFALTLTFLSGCRAVLAENPVGEVEENVTVATEIINNDVPEVQVTINPVGQNGNWDLIFSDEFDAESLDTKKWTTCFWWDWEHKGCSISSHNELQWYQPDDVFINDGVLILRAQPRLVVTSDGKPYQFTSGMISSGRDTKDTNSHAGLVFQYGYAEMRAKIPAGQGLWPAFWMLPDNNESKPEIDIFEILGNNPDTLHMAFHYLGEEGERKREKQTWIGPDFSSTWHVFAIDWQPDYIIWYVDGVERMRYTDKKNIPDRTMYLLINLAIGGDWPGNPDNTTPFPSFFEIDYVRVWKKR